MSSVLRRGNVMMLAALAAPLLAAPASAAEPAIEDLRDPTAPLYMDTSLSEAQEDSSFIDGLASALRSFKLNSILIRNDDRIAVINNQRVRVGDSIGSARVTEIGNTTVTLDIDGEPAVFSLYANSVKTLVATEEK